MDIVVADFQIKLLLTEQNQIGQFQRIDAQIVYQFGVQGNIVGVYGQFFNQKRFYFLKHNILLLPLSGLLCLFTYLGDITIIIKCPNTFVKDFFLIPVRAARHA